MTATAGTDEVLTIQQVAEVTGLAVQTLRNLRWKNEGPPMWLLRGRVRCYRADLDAWISAHAGHASVTPIKKRA
ncbi:helix-turn-helix transcriptional regulator [Microbacterium sp. A1-JK]|uniref:helix-turn-helix transcriptional regulator n=1 Tax=Microbacterium sp. A1-JK TaxID=3177516 RepID=UPI003883F6D5